MTTVCIAKERRPGERRVAMVPEQVSRLTALGPQVQIEAGLGTALGFPDEAFEAKGACVVPQRQTLLQQANVVLTVGRPCPEDIACLREGTVLIGFLDPFNPESFFEELASRKISGVSMEFIPRTTRAQKLDALSSQANLAGYVAVIIAANHLNRILPMMTTAAGTIPPARVLVIGAGVAGLQAIATAHRLGARVEGFDTRPAAAEQVKSLGARFVDIDIGESGETSQGYARALTDEQLARQREGLGKACARSDIIITTAQVFGGKAPLIVTASMLKSMRPGSVVLDLAVESGGNVEGSEPDRTVDVGGVRVIGLSELPGRVAANASQVYASNLVHWIEEFWNKDEQRLELRTEDDVIQSCLVTHDGRICRELSN